MSDLVKAVSDAIETADYKYDGLGSPPPYDDMAKAAILAVAQWLNLGANLGADVGPDNPEGYDPEHL